MTEGMTADGAMGTGGIVVRAQTGTGTGMTGNAGIAAEAEAPTGTGTSNYIALFAQLLFQRISCTPSCGVGLLNL